MTHDPSRKQFFARLAGIAALTGLSPKLFAKGGAAVSHPGRPGVPVTPLVIRVEPRAVARRAETI